MVNNNKYNDKGLRGFEARETIKPYCTFFAKQRWGKTYYIGYFIEYPNLLLIIRTQIALSSKVTNNYSNVQILMREKSFPLGISTT